MNLTTDTIKTFVVHFSCNGALRVQNNFLYTVKSIIQQVLRFWNSRMLLLKGRIIIFETLAISKIVYLVFLNVTPNSLIEELQKLQKTFVWHSWAKHVDISSKSINLQCSWLQKFLDENFHEWKIIPSHLINKYFTKSYKFHFIYFSHKLLIKFPECYRNILIQWSRSLFASFELPSCILSNMLWFNKHILIEKKIFFRYFSNKGLNVAYQLYVNNGNVKSWSSIKEEFGFNNFSNFK